MVTYSLKGSRKKGSVRNVKVDVMGGTKSETKTKQSTFRRKRKVRSAREGGK